jgi:hypothetical protein
MKSALTERASGPWPKGVHSKEAAVQRNGNGIQSVAHQASLERMGIDTKRVVNVGSFTEGQRHFLDFHRNCVLLRARL